MDDSNVIAICGFIALIVGLVVLVYFGITGSIEHKKTFMAECLQDHKQYECDAMWGEANPPTPTTTIIHTGR